MKRIQAKKHKIGTYEIDKISLSCFDDIRFVLDNAVNTLASFHKDCNRKCDKNKNKNDNDNENDNYNNKQYRYLGYQDSFCFIYFFFYERYFKRKKHKQKHFK